eukprot:2454514-Lingulodinium_polyedra.AAC.1
MLHKFTSTCAPGHACAYLVIRTRYGNYARVDVTEDIDHRSCVGCAWACSHTDANACKTHGTSSAPSILRASTSAHVTE